MYERSEMLTLVTNASAVGNNLTIQFSPQTKKALTVAVIHDGYINVVPICNTEIRAKYIPCIERGTRPRTVITSVTQVMWCIVGKQQIFVVASSIGVQIFDAEGRICKFSHPCLDLPEASSSFARGLALIGDDLLCVGNSSGTIRIFKIPEDSDELEKVECKHIHEKAVTDIASSTEENLLVTADDSGAVCLWKMEQELEPVSSFPTYGYPCTSLKMWKDFVLCGYGSGHIRVFDTKTAGLVSEIAGHARWITAIDIAPGTGYLLSVSEDSFAKVWHISRDGKVTHKFSTQVQDSLLVGGRFLSSEGDSFCVASYDSCDVVCYAT
ncbi:WD repeat-containing protein 54-like [Periplaneta americana]|uniref:WD repeat-containing protein 54-like n=1 Tax=Periplaneta americana TaxID=6978 RepID=UPI0037E88214